MILAAYVDRHPYRGAALFLVIMIATLVAAGGIGGLLSKDPLVQLAAGDTGLAVIGMILLFRLGWWNRAGYTRWIGRRHILLFLLPVIAALFPLANGIVVTIPSKIVGFLCLTLLIGFAEETFFRGLILTGLSSGGIVRAAVISSLLFAALHLLNLLGGIWDPVFTLADSIAAFGLGMTFAALRLRTGSILPVILLHALFDFSSLLTLGSIRIPAQSLQSLAGSVFAGIVFIAYGFFLLRNRAVRKEDALQTATT